MTRECAKCEGPFPSFEAEMQHVAFHSYIETRAAVPEWRDRPDEHGETAWSRLLRIVGIER